ncbi:glycerol-3-phosphate dehydrogenase [Helicobacter sp. 12S02634-8]|uniref:(Fe-S)-binding protein n=1 Tax=Helicobacter sp. 12S02634-8 TaxID=1476199 RepID=UPI000BA4FDBC|nr:(Fe-S)-binding protein [Helicobacter sp. 12S02634-8]PAF47507.1 glycerol-3-phosphate dehydrogenase [Helicobacter sp. 12S02634-8]
MHPLDYSSVAQDCVKCGKCIPSCTIYQVNRDESTSPRGFLDLLGAYDRNELPLDTNAKNIFESCFLCTTCVQVCPNSLPVDVMIEKIRVEIAQKYGIAWYKRAYFYLLKNRALMDFVFSFVYFISPCLFKPNTAKTKNRLRFRLPKMGKRTIFPFVSKSFLQSFQGEIPPSNPSLEPSKISTNQSNKALKHNRVGIFIGCLSNYNYIGVGESLLFILDRLGITALVPKQECCGAPAYFTGDIKTVLHLIKKNIAYFESFIDRVDAILIPEATCAAMLIEDWKHALLQDDNPTPWLERLKALTPKMAMASYWLEKHTPLNALLAQAPKSSLLASKITYHDPCHAKKVLHIHKEPRTLLQNNYTLVEMSDPSRCCGFGGVSMQSDKYDLVLQAGRPKAAMIAASGAEIVSAECSACHMQIDNAMDQAGVKAEFAHPLELVAKALGRV